MKRLALFLDGTWNDPKDKTNVHSLFKAAVNGQANGVEQRTHYGTGVGTKWNERIRGGTLGAGLSENVREAYEWLVTNYDDGDEIFIFGFSRGAYTARSVAGVIIRCGLLKKRAHMSVDDLYQRYQQGKGAKALYEMDLLDQHAKNALPDTDRALMACSRRVPIKMIGVWDTVGALGIPWTEAPLIGRGKFYFHNTNLSVLIEHAYHALAVDEFRGPYKPTLWTRFIPEQPDPPRTVALSETKVEQRWFIGAHSNVGGGYADDVLKRLPLAWLQQKAHDCGLQFSEQFVCKGDEFQTAPTDSYGEFMFGVYRLIRLGKKFFRPIGAEKRKVKRGWSEPINEVIDASVFFRYQGFDDYRPSNLTDWAKRKGIDLAVQRGDCVA
jgi:uncharacterized protein (DUF2235 family)